MTDQLVQEIYIQLLELYTFDLEVELLSETLKNVSTTPVKPYPFSEKYDAYYNEESNEWLESKCDDPTCEFCVDRPDKPL